MRQLEYTEQQKQKGLLPDMNKIICQCMFCETFLGEKQTLIIGFSVMIIVTQPT